MYPLLDTRTLNRATRDGRKAAEAARVARDARTRAAQEPRPRHGVRYAVGASLVKAGLRLIHA